MCVCIIPHVIYCKYIYIHLGQPNPGNFQGLVALGRFNWVRKNWEATTGWFIVMIMIHGDYVCGFGPVWLKNHPPREHPVAGWRLACSQILSRYHMNFFKRNVAFAPFVHTFPDFASKYPWATNRRFPALCTYIFIHDISSPAISPAGFWHSGWPRVKRSQSAV